MNGTQISIPRKIHKVSLSSLLESRNGTALKSEVGLEVLSDLTKSHRSRSEIGGAFPPVDEEEEGFQREGQSFRFHREGLRGAFPPSQNKTLFCGVGIRRLGMNRDFLQNSIRMKEKKLDLRAPQSSHFIFQRQPSVGTRGWHSEGVELKTLCTYDITWFSYQPRKFKQLNQNHALRLYIREN
ncbi:hypothetical protein NE237_028380 [Protea cynaroides]|uniref:Uncharacterized protein n=1 Tax=Protea cynaroides TaxID=273540 RepID=A0A9Q0GRX4_9MAGN|nr:hypothetical protein NE237_028380 [Protea cynaroides]